MNALLIESRKMGRNIGQCMMGSSLQTVSKLALRALRKSGKLHRHRLQPFASHALTAAGLGLIGLGGWASVAHARVGH